MRDARTESAKVVSGKIENIDLSIEPKMLTTIVRKNARTDSGESGLWNLVSVQRFVATYQHPVKWVADILSIPPGTVSPPPRVVYLCSNTACLV